MKQTILLAVLAVLGSLTGRGQNIGGQVGPGGNAPGGGKAGTDLVNVDLYTGVGSVNIPVYSYGVDNLGLGVSLVYGTKGIPVNSYSSSVGLGWALQAAGVITREVRGIEDEVTLPTRFIHPNKSYYSWGFVPGPGICESNQSCTNHHDSLQGILVPDAIDPDHRPTPSHYTPYPVYDDEETDVFHFSLGQRSFSFVFRKTPGGLKYYTYPKSEVTIEAFTKDYDTLTGSYTNVRPGFSKGCGLDSLHNLLSFLITDESGNKFYFERGDYQVKEFDLDSNFFIPSRGTYYAADNWVLDKVETYTGKEIRFRYRKKYLAFIQMITETLSSQGGYGYAPDYTVTHNALKIDTLHWKGYKTHLSEIEYPDGALIRFNLAAGPDDRCDIRGDYLLRSITLESRFTQGYGHTITYRLNHAYFNTPRQGLSLTEIPYGTGASIEAAYLTAANGFNSQQARDLHRQSGLRLKLKSISRIGTDSISSEKAYSFSYNGTPLPYRFDPGQDYYGYYNGETAVPFPWYTEVPGNPMFDTLFYLSIPYHTVNTVVNPYDAGGAGAAAWGVKRHYSLPHAQACVLTKITNGLGGSDSIVYTDYHLTNPDCSYGDFYNYPMTAPIGCTIDSQVEGDTVNDGLVIGRIISKDPFTADRTTTTEYTYQGGVRFFRGGYMSYPEKQTVTETQFAYTNYFADPHNFVNGSNHGFDTVTVCTYGYNNERLSKGRYFYTGLLYGGVSAIRKLTGDKYRGVAADIRKYKMGFPLMREEYDEHDNITYLEENIYERKTLNDSFFAISRYVVPRPSDEVTYIWTEVGYFKYLILDYERLRLKEQHFYRAAKGPGVTIPRLMLTAYRYEYDELDNVKVITWTDSKGDQYKKRRYYNYDYALKYPAIASLGDMGNRSMQFLLSSEVWRMTGADSVLLSYELAAPEFNSSKTRLRFPASFTSVTDAPLSSAKIAVYPLYDQFFARKNALDFRNYDNYGLNLEKAKEFTLYDERDNVLEMRINDQELYESYIWDTRLLNKIAEVKNARYRDIAFTSFEGTYRAPGIADDNKGNWWFDRDRILRCSPGAAVSKAITGSYVYELKQVSNSDSNHIQSRPLSNQAYIVSFWTYTPHPGAAIEARLLNGGTETGTVPTSVVNTVGNWQLHAGTFTPAAGGQLRIKNYTGAQSGKTAYIDEVRLYPADAAMTTTTFKPLFGAGSTCDERSIISYIEYDAFGRAAVVRDMRGNITTKTETAQDDPDGGSGGTPITNQTTY